MDETSEGKSWEWVEDVEAEVIEDTVISNCDGSNVTLLRSFVKTT